MEMSSFSAFLPAPDLAGSYLGGVAASQKAAEIANQHQQASAAIAMQGQKLQQEQQQAAMENQIKQQQLQQESMRAQQELQIKGQYDQQMADLKKQQLATAHQALQEKIKESAQQFQYQQQYQSRIKGGEDAQKVYQELGPLMGMRGTGMSPAFRQDNSGRLGTMGTNEQGIPFMYTGNTQVTPMMPATLPDQMQQGDQPDSEGESAGTPEPGIPSPSGAQIPQTPQQFGAATARQGLQQRAQAATRQESLALLKVLESQDAKDYDGADFASALADGKKLTPGQEKTAKRWLDRQDRMDQITKRLGKNTGLDQPRKSGDGEKYPTATNKKTGEKMIFKDGKWQSP